MLPAGCRRNVSGHSTVGISTVRAPPPVPRSAPGKSQPTYLPPSLSQVRARFGRGVRRSTCTSVGVIWSSPRITDGVGVV
jgi:hypothetical protein